MARDEITVNLPVQDVTESIETIAITKQSVTVANGIKVKDAWDNKNNSLVIIIEPTTAAAVTFKAGDAYPNSMLGDLVVTPTNSKSNVYLIDDIARFQTSDGALLIDFGSNFVGTIYAVAKRAGIKPVA